MKQIYAIFLLLFALLCAVFLTRCDFKPRTMENYYLPHIKHFMQTRHKLTPGSMRVKLLKWSEPFQVQGGTMQDIGVYVSYRSSPIPPYAGDTEENEKLFFFNFQGCSRAEDVDQAFKEQYANFLRSQKS